MNVYECLMMNFTRSCPTANKIQLKWFINDWSKIFHWF